MDVVKLDAVVRKADSLARGDTFAEGDHPRGEGGQFSKSEEHAAHEEHHKGLQTAHAEAAKELGESGSRPPHGSHAEAASHHHSAAFYHGEARKHYESGDNDRAEGSAKQAKRQSSIANSASKTIATGKKPYPVEKENTAKIGPTHEESQKANAARIGRYLSQKWIR